MSRREQEIRIGVIQDRLIVFNESETALNLSALLSASTKKLTVHRNDIGRGEISLNLVNHLDISTDRLVVDFSGGNPIPTQGLRFDGASPEGLALGTLQLIGDKAVFQTAISTATGAHSGIYKYDDKFRLEYDNLAPIIDTVPETSQAYNLFPGGVNINTGPPPADRSATDNNFIFKRMYAAKWML